MEQSFFEYLQSGMDGYSLPHLVWHLLIVAVCILITGAFSVADTISGVYTAKKTGEKLRSHRLRKTFEKMAVYWFFQILVGLLGLVLTVFSFYDLPYFSIALMLGICITELISMREHSKRRKDGIAKITETVRELVELVGGKDEARQALLEFMQKQLGEGAK